MKLTRQERELMKAPLSRKDAVLSLLRGAIMDGRLAAGEKLDQNEIADSFGVSRTPVREALKQLEIEGLVAVYPYRGVVVSSLDADELEELFEIRIALEKAAVAGAAGKLSTRQVARLRSVLRDMDAIVDDPQSDDEWMQLNHEFHKIINDACGRPRLIALIDQYRGNVQRYVRTYLKIFGREQSQREHWELFDACAEGRVQLAQKVIERHLRNTARALQAALQAVEQDGSARIRKERVKQGRS
jgi:DNA-binding GntR family transcriptional regulator